MTVVNIPFIWEKVELSLSPRDERILQYLLNECDFQEFTNAEDEIKMGSLFAVALRIFSVPWKEFVAGRLVYVGNEKMLFRINVCDFDPAKNRHYQKWHTPNCSFPAFPHAAAYRSYANEVFCHGDTKYFGRFDLLTIHALRLYAFYASAYSQLDICEFFAKTRQGQPPEPVRW